MSIFGPNVGTMITEHGPILVDAVARLKSGDVVVADITGGMLYVAEIRRGELKSDELPIVDSIYEVPVLLADEEDFPLQLEWNLDGV